MKKYFMFLIVFAVLANTSFLVSCGSNEPKKPVAKEDQDFSSSGMIKEMEEMQKAADRGKPAIPANPAETKEHPASPAPQK